MSSKCGGMSVGLFCGQSNIYKFCMCGYLKCSLLRKQTRLEFWFSLVNIRIHYFNVLSYYSTQFPLIISDQGISSFGICFRYCSNIDMTHRTLFPNEKVIGIGYGTGEDTKLLKVLGLHTNCNIDLKAR